MSYIEHKTNEYVRQQVDTLARKQEPLLGTVKRCKLSWSGYVTRHNTIAKTIPQGTLEGKRQYPGGQETTGPSEKKLAR